MKYKIKLVEVGMFNMPGAKILDNVEEDSLETIKNWIVSEKCGTMESNNLVWFFEETERDKFMEQWADLESDEEVLDSSEIREQLVTKLVNKLFDGKVESADA